jgi:4-hydroxy-tetrahydrodipicolinate synthase
MTSAALAGDARMTVAMASALLPVVDAGYAEPNPAIWKAALHATGEIRSAGLRAPLTAAKAESTASLLAVVADVMSSEG